MEYKNLKAQLEKLESEAQQIRAQEHYLRAWVGKSLPSGNARGVVSAQYQLRSRQPIFNGKKSRYLRASEVTEAKVAVARGRQLLQLEQQAKKVRAKLIKIEQTAVKHGLSLPKMDAFSALTQSKTNEWSTRPKHIALAKEVLGPIELDPATNKQAQKYIQAKTFYTINDDGFNKAWIAATLWLNPPFGTKKPTAHDWILKAAAEYDAGNIGAGILLVRGDSKGLKELEKRFACCNPHNRIAFIDINGQEQGNPPPGCRFFYMGSDKEKFKAVFSRIGTITVPA